MKMPNSYTYRFFYKAGFYLMSLVCILLITAWITTAVQRDNNKKKEMYYRDKYITYKALYLVSVIQTDLVIDQITSQEMAMWDLYCSRKDLFRENIARKAMETETKQGK
jgi:hypothetical protein